MTLVVNLFGGPGTGKSTTAASLFAALKLDGYEAELVTEFAKDLTWEARHNALHFSPYVVAEQMYRVHRLLGQVDVVVTDSPILLALVYPGEGCTPAFEQFVVDMHHSWHSLNILLARHEDKPYVRNGRNQSATEAITLDRTIALTLGKLGIGFHVESGPPAPIDRMLRHVKEALHG